VLKYVALALLAASPLAADNEHPCNLFDPPFAICVSDNAGLEFQDKTGTSFEILLLHESGAFSAVSIHYFETTASMDVQMAKVLAALVGSEAQAQPLDAPAIIGADSATVETSLAWQGAPARGIVTLATSGALGLSVYTWAPEGSDLAQLVADHRRIAAWMRAQGVESRP
jgi:hypothetical protein